MKMLKKWLALLCMLCLLPLCAAAEEVPTVDSVEALQEFLIQCREEGRTDFAVKCGSALYSEVKADNNAFVYRLCTLAGIESFDLLTNRSGKLTFTFVTYGSPYIAECATEAEVKSTLSAFMAEDAPEMTLMCTADLFQSLFRNGCMYRLMAELGVEDFTMKGNTSNHIFLSELQTMTTPWAAVGSVSEAGEKAAAWREENVSAFNLLFDMDAYSALTRNDYSLIAFLGGLDNYRLSYNNYTGMLYFTEVTYSDIPGAYCQSEDEVVAAIRAMGAQGHTSFQLKLDETTYEALKANSFARLYELQGQAGMTSGSMSFSSVSCIYRFDNAVIVSDVTVLTSLAEVTAHMEECVKRGDSEISMLLSDDVYDALMDGVAALFGSDAKFYDMIANAGVAGADDISFNRHSGAISLRGVHYYAGTNILRAVENGDLSVLTDRERQAYEAAKTLAADCARSTQEETARAIHDALCAMIVYTDDEATDEDDCCIGALLTGQANCDGYADAMVLVGKLAGLNVRYQHGDSREGGMASYFSTHMWNLIELDGSWRMIDATWDDRDGEPLYLWFNIGEDRASLSHVWSAEMTVPMLAETDLSSRPVAEYFAASADEVTAAAVAAQLASNAVFEIYLSADCGLGRIAAREALLAGLSGSVYYTWVEPLLCMHVELIP